MNERDRAARGLGLIYDLAAIAIMGSTMLFAFAGIDAGLYAAAGSGAVVSFALGYRSMRARRFTLGQGTARYAKLWLLMTVVSGLTLVNGRWQPLAVFAVTSAAMLLLYALGGWLGTRNSPGDQQP
jgi:hypothetical protein